MLLASLLPVAALLVSVFLVMLGHGLQMTLVPLRAELEGFSSVAVGIAASGYSIGFIAGCLLIPHAVQRAGHIRAFAAIISLASAAALLPILVVHPLAWTGFRGLTGLAVAGFYVIIESWLNDRASNATRGLVLSVYVLLQSVAFVIGQAAVSFADVGGYGGFAVAAVAISLAVMPVALTRSSQPAQVALVRLRPKRLYQVSPGAFVAVLLIGLATGSLLALGPLYATGIGQSPQFAALFSAALFAGGALLQWPLGRTSDFVDRRVVLVLCGAGASLAAILLTLPWEHGPTALLLFAAMVGAFVQPGYSIASAHAFDAAPPEDYVETSSGVLLLYGIGAAIGPLLAALLMQRLGPQGLFHFIAAMEAAMAVYLFIRIRARARPPADIPMPRSPADRERQAGAEPAMSNPTAGSSRAAPDA